MQFGGFDLARASRDAAAILTLGALIWTAIATTRAARAAAKSAATAAASIESAERSAVISQRAYLFISDVIFDLFGSQISYRIRNGGQTPALVIGRYLRALPLQYLPQVRDEVSFAHEATVIPAGSESNGIEFSLELPLNPEHLGLIRVGKLSLFFYGSQMYRDLFGKYNEIGFVFSHTGQVEQLNTTRYVSNAAFNYFRFGKESDVPEPRAFKD